MSIESSVVLEATFLSDSTYIDFGVVDTMSELADELAKRLDVVSVRVYGYCDGSVVDYTIYGDFSRNRYFEINDPNGEEEHYD